MMQLTGRSWKKTKQGESLSGFINIRFINTPFKVHYNCLSHNSQDINIFGAWYYCLTQRVTKRKKTKTLNP